MRGVTVPPSEEDFTADPVELFFDLAYVFAFSRLVYHLVHQPTWSGFGQFVLIFMMIWLPWTQFTWSANAVAGNSRPVRVLFLIGTVASVPLATSATTAFADGGLTFALATSGILLLGLAMMRFILPAEHPARASVSTYSIPQLSAILLMVAGGLLDDGWRLAAWITSMVVVFASTILAGRLEWLVRPGHIAERHGLIVIIALGEIIVALSAPLVEHLEEGHIPTASKVAMTAAGAIACLLWWAYFDRANRALEHQHNQQDAPLASGRYARDVWTYCHLLIAAGIIVLAAAIEEVALHPDHVLPTAFRWMFAGGFALFSAGIAIAVFRAFRVVAKERVVAAVLVVAFVVVAGRTQSALTLLLFTDAVLFAALIFENIRIESKPRQAIADS